APAADVEHVAERRKVRDRTRGRIAPQLSDDVVTGAVPLRRARVPERRAFDGLLARVAHVLARHGRLLLRRSLGRRDGDLHWLEGVLERAAGFLREALLAPTEEATALDERTRRLLPRGDLRRLLDALHLRRRLAIVRAAVTELTVRV